MNFKVIGAGGIGGCLLPTLCRVLNYGTGDQWFSSTVLDIIDGDIYEEKNRARQTFDSFDNKAKSTVEMLKKDFDRMVIRSHPSYIDENNVNLFIKNKDIIFLCVDNHATRKIVSDYCETLENCTLISGGNEVTDGNIQLFLKRNGENLTLPLCNKFHNEIVNPIDEVPKYQEIKSESCTQKAEKDPQLLITNFAVASLMLNCFYSVVSGEKVCYDEVYCDIVSQKVRPVSRSVKNV